jgi:hypothetical protein
MCFLKFVHFAQKFGFSHIGNFMTSALMVITWNGILPNAGHIVETCFKDFVCPIMKSLLDSISPSSTAGASEDPSVQGRNQG